MAEVYLPRLAREKTCGIERDGPCAPACLHASGSSGGGEILARPHGFPRVAREERRENGFLRAPACQHARKNKVGWRELAEPGENEWSFCRRSQRGGTKEGRRASSAAVSGVGVTNVGMGVLVR